VRVQTVAAAGRTRSDASIPHPSSGAPPSVILSPEGAKNPIAPEALALSSPFFPTPANPAAYTKGTSHHRGGCRAPASGSPDAPHLARDRAPPRPAVCEDGEWRDRRPRLLSPQRPRSFHYQASVSEHGPSGRHPRALASFPRKRGSSRRSSCVGRAVRAAVIPTKAGIQPLSVLCEARDAYYEELRQRPSRRPRRSNT